MDERRTAWLFLLVLGAQLLVLISSVPAASGEGSVLRSLGLGLLGPVAAVTSATSDAATGVVEGLRGQRSLREENGRLRDELEALRLEVARLGGLENEVRRLAAALGSVRNTPGKLRLAEVVYLDRSAGLSTLVLVGRAAPPEVDQPVLAAGGLVGRVVEVAGSYGRVQLITDAVASVGAMIERSGVQGVVRGSPDGQLELAFIPRQETVEVGDRVVTAGIDGIYPPGILIGSVVELPPSEGFSLKILLAAAVDFNRLGHVYLLERRGLPDEIKGAGVGERR